MATTAKINLTTLNAGLQAVSVALPQLMAAYAAYRAIWTMVNPGATEEDYLAHLAAASQRNVSAADAILLADGYVRDAGGNWIRPPQ